MPFFLYDIPQEAIFDLLHGRLSVIVLVNPARFAEALEEHGFSVDNPSHGKDSSVESFVISKSMQERDGRKYKVEMYNFGFHISEIVHEFKSVQHLVRVVQAVLNHEGIKPH